MATLPTRKTSDIKPADQLVQVQSTAAQQAVVPPPNAQIDVDAQTINMRVSPPDPVAAPSSDVALSITPPPTPVITFHVAPSRKTLMTNAQSRIALKPPQADSDSHAITLFWNPRPAANATPADPQSISIGAQNAPRLVYTGYGVTIPAGHRGIVVSLPEHGPVRPLMYLLAGRHDIDLAIPHSYAGTNVHGVQIGPCAAVGRLILERSVGVQCEVEE